jgi:hypothetical protein
MVKDSYLLFFFLFSNCIPAFAFKSDVVLINLQNDGELGNGAFTPPPTGAMSSLQQQVNTHT